jgi:hypothetical protein
VNLNTNNLASLHTLAGCTMDQMRLQTGLVSSWLPSIHNPHRNQGKPFPQIAILASTSTKGVGRRSQNPTRTDRRSMIMRAVGMPCKNPPGVVSPCGSGQGTILRCPIPFVIVMAVPMLPPVTGELLMQIFHCVTASTPVTSMHTAWSLT